MWWKLTFASVTLVTFTVVNSAPSVALDLEEQRAIATRVQQSLAYISVDAVTAPKIKGFNPKAIFWIRNNEKRNYTYAFSSGNYTFGISDPSNIGVGAYLCATTQQILYQLPRLEPRFLRKVKISGSATVPAGDVMIGINVDGLGAFFREALAAARYLGDWVSSKTEAKFFVLVRGHADSTLGAGFTRDLQASPYDFHVVDALPPDPSDSTGLLSYQQIQTAYPIPNPYGNDQLPELRSRFIVQSIINPVLSDCKKADIQIYILKGKADKDVQDPELRKVDLYLYAY